MIGTFELLRLFNIYQNSFGSKSKQVFAYLFFRPTAAILRMTKKLEWLGDLEPAAKKSFNQVVTKTQMPAVQVCKVTMR